MSSALLILKQNDVKLTLTVRGLFGCFLYLLSGDKTIFNLL